MTTPLRARNRAHRKPLDDDDNDDDGNVDNVARWRSGWGTGLAINRSPVRFPAATLPGSDPG